MSRKPSTTDDPDKSSGWRGSREIWLAAAKRAFLETGLDAVKIQPLATRLNISRTSFYWFFKDRNALLDALLEDDPESWVMRLQIGVGQVSLGGHEG